MNHCIHAVLGLALATDLLAVCVPTPLSSISNVNRPTIKPPPISDRRIDVNGYCSQTEEDGFREQATFTVADNNISVVQWQLWVGQRGSCQSDLLTLQQTRRRFSIELRECCGDYTLMVWQGPCRVTLVHTNCKTHYMSDVYEEAWPVMFDPQTGQYTQNAR